MSWFDSLTAACIPLVPKAVMRRFSGRYIAGEEREDALRRGRELASAGYRITYDQLGEAVQTPQEVDAAVAEDLQLLADLVQQNLERNISVKPTQMGLNLGEDLCVQAMTSILKEAKQQKAFVRFEMEESETVDASLRVFSQLRAKYGDTVGMVLQAMLRRSGDDVEQLLAENTPLNVRLVKGIYVEPAAIAYQDAQEIRQSYLRIMQRLLAGGAFVAVASHDEILIDALQKLIQDNPTYASQCEVQMLLGVREELRQKVKASGMPVRVYVPYGPAWHKYVVRRLKKNPKLARYALLGMFGKQEKF